MPPSFPQVLDSLDTHPPTASDHASHNTLNWAWTVFAIALFMNLGVMLFSLFKPRKNMLLNHLSIIMLTTSTIAWYTLASNLGNVPILPEADDIFRTRSFYYVRYIQYFINMPLQILVLVLGTGYPWVNSSLSMFFAAAAVVCGLSGSFVTSDYKWGFFTIGIFLMLIVLFHLYAHVGLSKFPGPSGVTHVTYCMSLLYMTTVWIMYPIAWACNEATNITNVRDELIWYGILDTFNFPLWLAFFLFTHRNVTSKYIDIGTGRHMDATPLHEEHHEEK